MPGQALTDHQIDHQIEMFETPNVPTAEMEQFLKQYSKALELEAEWKKKRQEAAAIGQLYQTKMNDLKEMFDELKILYDFT